MASFNNTEELTVSVELQIPRPVIIFTGTGGIQYWKQFFVLKKNEESDSTKEILYNRCIKLLLWAEFCNATLSYVGNSKDSEGNFTVKFTFCFPDDDCKFLFQMDWESNVKVVAK